MIKHSSILSFTLKGEYNDIMTYNLNQLSKLLKLLAGGVKGFTCNMPFYIIGFFI